MAIARLRLIFDRQYKTTQYYRIKSSGLCGSRLVEALSCVVATLYSSNIPLFLGKTVNLAWLVEVLIEDVATHQLALDHLVILDDS